jgi:predicted nucleic acid-binding protein
VSSLLVLPDNTVLVNFAHLNRMDLLAKLVKDNGAWCASVATECDQSARVPGLEAMADAYVIFGEPLWPQSPGEFVMTQAFRTRLARPGDSRLRHLGEAETLAIMTSRAIRGIFVTDDSSVIVIAQEQGIQVVTTFDLLRVACRAGMVDADTVWSYVQKLRQDRRGSPPGVYDRSTFDKWMSP